tara:strand:+ start:1148 stop:2689 length:1542 start_codon:yes stop_codon:yes gene_type:complete
MPLDIFGFSIGRKKPTEPYNSATEPSKQESFVPPDSYDGTYTLESGGVFGTLMDFTGSVRDENQLIQQFRNMSLYPEVDQAIEDITNESIVMDIDKKPIKLDLERVNLSDNIKNKIHSEYDNILKLLNFHNYAYDIYRRWYVDSKLYYHIMIDKENPQKGIIELRAINPLNIKKIQKVKKEQKHIGTNRVPFIKEIEEFYVYTDTSRGSLTPTSSSGIKIAVDSICYIHSGIIDSNSKRVVGYLQKAIRPLNMLRQIEDAVVIYRISRAPERRIFYIDVGNLPKQKAEQYIKSIMTRYRNKVTYDATTGEVTDGRDHLHMLEDFWLPRREGGRGTEITTLEGGQNLGEMEDVEYLLKKVYRALNVPVSRMEPDNGFNMGRSAEITRDEVKFSKFIDKLRMKFSLMFMNLLRIQVVLKGIMSEEDWKKIEPNINFTYNRDSHFSELKQSEIMRDRLELLSQADEYIGKYYSIDWIRKNILQQSEEDIKLIDIDIQKEMSQQSEEPEEGEEDEQY